MPSIGFWAFDLAGRQWKLRPVLETFELPHDSFIELVVDGETIRSTPRHPFWVVDGEDLNARPRPEHITAAEEELLPSRSQLPGRWVDAGDLRIGDVLFRRSGGPAVITQIDSFQELQSVYNFAVDDLHCYAVGHCETLVHNNCGPELVQLQLPAPQPGSLFERTLQTSKGPVTFLAEVDIVGKLLHLKDVVVYGQGSVRLTGLTKEVVAARRLLINQARAMGFEQLRITGQRVASSSSANPGHLIDIIIDLTRL